MGSPSPRILCTGIAVLDEIFRVDEFPPPDGKAQASEFVAVGGGCAAKTGDKLASSHCRPPKLKTRYRSGSTITLKAALPEPATHCSVYA